MKTLLTTLLALLTGGASLFGQTSIDGIIAEVEKNNTTLAALRTARDAGRIGNHTGVALRNPDVEFHYLWGTPAVNGNRTDLYISQSFDFPTVYSWKNRIAGGRDMSQELAYQKERKEILLKARLVMADIICANALQHQYDLWLTGATRLAEAYRSKLDRGEGTILEFNKSQLYLLGLRREAENNAIVRRALLSELAAFNGGGMPGISDTSFTYTPFATDFEAWYRETAGHIPELNLLRSEVEVNMSQERLNLALSLPRFSAGYMSEMGSVDKLQGITAGITVPLWENSNTVKFAKARTLAAKEIETDRQLQLTGELRRLHARAVALQQSVTGFRNTLRLYNNTALLDKALDSGEISLLNYLLELTVYHESTDQLIRSEQELNRAVMELQKYR